MIGPFLSTCKGPQRESWSGGRPGWPGIALCVALVLCLAIAASNRPVIADELVDVDKVDFQRDVQPILARHCVRCHRADKAKGDVRLDSLHGLLASGYVVVGSADESELIHLVGATEGQPPQMPKEGTPLSDQQIETLSRWIRQGAPWPADVVVTEAAQADASWWSLQPLAQTRLPDVADAPDAWRRDPLDRFVIAELRRQGLTPSPPAAKRTLIRRATYDLTGLPPSPAEVRAFLADSRTDAYERLIDRLLASPAYGERWGRHWLDVVRFGESRGFERNEIINNLWPFRDYVITSFNHDKPFDQLVREHLAGDQLGQDRPDLEVGTSFLVGGPYDDVGNQDPVQAAQIRANTIDEMIRTTSEAFLGLTVGCARCHNHKFDPILQQDYYGLYATFAGVHHGSRTLATPKQREIFVAAMAPLQADQAEIQQRRQQLEHEIGEQATAIAAQVDGASDATFGRSPSHAGRVCARGSSIRAVVGRRQRSQSRRGTRLHDRRIRSLDFRRLASECGLGAEGATAEGDSRTADDFDQAYSPALTIDGKFGAALVGGRT